LWFGEPKPTLHLHMKPFCFDWRVGLCPDLLGLIVFHYLRSSFVGETSSFPLEDA
jgi:hypothetical protein